MSVARVWALPGLGGMGRLRAEFAAGTETPHPSHRKKQALPAVHPNSKPWAKTSPGLMVQPEPPSRSRCGPNIRNPSGDDLAGRSVMRLIEQPRVVGRLQIDLARAPARRSCFGYEPSGGVDRARGAHGDEEISPIQGRVDHIHVHRHLAEPHYIRTQAAGLSASGTP